MPGDANLRSRSPKVRTRRLNSPRCRPAGGDQHQRDEDFMPTDHTEKANPTTEVSIDGLDVIGVEVVDDGDGDRLELVYEL